MNGYYSKAISNKINTLIEGASANATGDDGYTVVGQAFGTQFTNEIKQLLQQLVFGRLTKAICYIIKAVAFIKTLDHDKRLI